MAETEPNLGLKEFLDSCTDIHEDTRLFFPNVGGVDFTTITRANLGLLRRTQQEGFPGIIISCPDFARESLAIAFLGALQHLVEDEGDVGIHEVTEDERAAIGECVIDVTSVSEDRVMFASRDENNVGFLREYFDFPLVHTASDGAELSRTRKKVRLRDAAEKYESLPGGIRLLLDICGKDVPSIGYVSSPSMYLEEPPTHILRGSISVDGDKATLGRSIPISYVSKDGAIRNGFEWPFSAPPSIMVGPRIDGVGSAYPIVEQARGGAKVDFVALNIPGPESLETSLMSDILDLVDEEVSVVGFCDRWTLDRMGPLKERGFLLFDWGDCEIAERADYCVLSPVQWNMRGRQHEKVVPIHDEESGISKAKEILYDQIGKVDFYTDEAWRAKQDLFLALGSAIRMTEAPDEAYSNRMRQSILEAVEAIESSRTLSQEGFSELCSARDILLDIYRAGNVLPKEEKVYDLITDRLVAKLPVVLVVDRSRTEWVYEYWKDVLAYNDYPVDKFRVINTRDFMAGKGLRGNESVIFSGWYDRGTMDRALHSGIVADMTFVLYHDGSGGLEVEWWRRANEQWHRSSDRCAGETDATLAKLGIEKAKRPKKRMAHAQAPVTPSSLGQERDDSPVSIITDIERRRLQRDVARKGEAAVAAVPVMFDDGSHVWLRSGSDRVRGGRLVVITDCLAGQDDEPERKPASAVLKGDVVLRTHSSKAYIRKAAEERLNGYQNVWEVAHRWREPIANARMSGMSDYEIISRIHERTHGRSVVTVRTWVMGERIAPQSEDDIRAIFSAFRVYIRDEDVMAIVRAARLIRGQHQRTGMMAAEKMVRKFLEDVGKYGLDDAVAGFDERHESGNIELLTVSAVGKQMRVSVERAEIV